MFDKQLTFWIAGLILSSTLLGGTGSLAATADPPADSGRSAIAIEALSRLKGIDLEANPTVKAAVLKVLEKTRGTPQFVELVRDFNVPGQQPALLEMAVKNPGISIGVEAMRLFLRSPDEALLKSALATNAANVIEVMGNTEAKEIVPLLAPVISDPALDLSSRKLAIRALARVREGAAALLQLAKENRLNPELKLTASSALHEIRWEDLKAQADQLLPLPASQNAQPLPPIAEMARLKGDKLNGAAVFRRESVGCIKCHQVNGEGIDFGPNLSEIGTKLGKDALYEAILDPSAGISFGFEAWEITFTNGDDAYGLIVNETADELAVKAVGGIVTRYKKSEIAQRTKQRLSIMPAGLPQAMSEQELVDLVEYLAGLKKADPERSKIQDPSSRETP
jgi:putative heme-binding domain-containing protein